MRATATEESAVPVQISLKLLPVLHHDHQTDTHCDAAVHRHSTVPRSKIFSNMIVINSI